ncbi:ogr/Delta-like zinc finger family protein [Phytopseudomonas daroniae]|uniref:ogr/Delta-like zinc finger family protein n=1 Tax=Phytopseudomonas daroniae TaxID=2487519 RepID=UPI0010384EB4|nr:ogr/Delta-like zinc finger family protein [Pseudomonas daroniae]TBU78185.1 transcriptional regulator [Pseudomonas daroniae]
MSTYKLVCPACRGGMRIRTSVGQTPCFRSTYYQCQNVACGATFSGSVTIDYQLSPSGLEQPLMVLPVAPAMERMKALRDNRTATDQLDLLEALEATA